MAYGRVMKTRVIIDANQRARLFEFKELVAYRELFWMLAWRDFRVRYVQTVLGLGWAFVQPVVNLLVAGFVYGHFQSQSTGEAVWVSACCGVALWTYFAFVIDAAGSSLVQAQQLLKKVYFPRLIIPFSKAVLGLIDFAIVLMILFVFIAFDRDSIVVSSRLILAPLCIVSTLAAGVAAGIWISALTIRFRDLRHAVQFIVRAGMLISPVMYPARSAVAELPSWAVPVYYLNPMAGIIESFRWTLVGTPAPPTIAWLSIGVVVLLLTTGVVYFRRVEGEMADFV